MMKLEELRELIQLMRDNQIAEIDLEEEGKRVRVVAAQSPSHAPVAVPTPVVIAPVPTLGDPAIHAASVAAAAAPPPEKEEGVTVTSPIVGTFYSSPSPEAPPYVKEGDEVDEETVLCIVEAMKVMNEIKAEIKGRILKILADNGHPVEFGQPLFRVLPVG
ncbi:acetyl-CoA carboxylase biotin carboxyl carrier protein [Candidatus Sumerlaeota bacterium]|nr:acetyl-CoA carboxylase biotin carboxyl carrier protein [Candidatus Sumerlaeota bacterium]MBI3735790.1 acetyl-CoA carboxylase biotin carboxyl carrier protein [Candidatus Sumerlaeota bacterium]